MTTQFFTNPILQIQKASHDDFTFITQLAFDPNIILVKADSPYQTIGDLLEAAKKNPKLIKWAGTGSTGSDRVLSLMLEEQTGAIFNFVPFQSGGEATTALLGGHVDIITNQMNECYSQIVAGNIRALAIGSEDRSEFMPEIPTLIEAGTNIVSGSYRGIAAPADIPEEAKAELEAMFKELSNSKMWKNGFIDKFQMQGKYLNGRDFKNLTKRKIAPEYEKVFRAVGAIK